ncbi:MAG: hypothetical protein IJD57_06060 [Candidatus Gastranaerophilales bacterium]|nr:hypothetical protein [Candidatus Gastranaerophilales bacterium]
MSNISFTGNATTKMQKLVEKAIKKGDLNGQQVQKFYKHILNNGTDTFSYSLKKVDFLPDHMMVDVFKKSSDGICEYGVKSGAVPTKDIPKVLTNCLKQFLNDV